MQRFKLKKQAFINRILSSSVLAPGVLTSTLLAGFSAQVLADHLTLRSIAAHAEPECGVGAYARSSGDGADLLQAYLSVDLYQPGSVGAIGVLPGMGRSINVGLILNY